MTDPDTPIRAFIAVGVSLEARTELENAIQRLDAQAPTGIRWVKPSGLHLTLKFLGDVSPQNLPEIIHAVGQSAAESPALLIHLSGLGVFPNERNPRVLRAGVEGDLEALANLQEKIEDAIVSLGFPRERRPFSPSLDSGQGEGSCFARATPPGRCPDVFYDSRAHRILAGELGTAHSQHLDTPRARCIRR